MPSEEKLSPLSQIESAWAVIKGLREANLGEINQAVRLESAVHRGLFVELRGPPIWGDQPFAGQEKDFGLSVTSRFSPFRATELGMFLRVLRGTELGDFFISEMDGFNEMAQTTSVYRYWRQCERADGTTGNRQFDDEIQEGRAMLGQLADLADRIHLFLCSRIPHSDFEGKVGLFGRIDGKMLCSYLIDRSKK